MGYACPVCGTPQPDAAHLANHLAIVALTRGDDHEAWLDEHAPDWSDDDPERLGERVVSHAERREYETVFEDTVHGHDGSPDAGRPGSAGVPPAGDVPVASPDDEATREALAEARRLAREHRDGEDND